MALRGSLDRLRRELDAVRRELAVFAVAGDAGNVNRFIVSAGRQLRPDELPADATPAQRRAVEEVCWMDFLTCGRPVLAADGNGPFSTFNGELSYE